MTIGLHLNQTIELKANTIQIFSHFFNLIGREWDHRIITYSFQNSTLDITIIAQRQSIRNALDLWEDVTDIVFLEVCNETNADIAFSWGVQNHNDPNPICYPELGLGPFDNQNGVLAHSMGGPGPNDCGNQAGDIHFDDDETWTNVLRNNDSQPIDLETVAAHEIGHSLGLFHTNVSGSLMEADYTGSHRFLGPDDIAGIQSIYGTPANNNFVSGPNFLCSTNTLILEDVPVAATVSWTVTPTRLFSGSTSGTGSSATLTPFHTNTSGQATITFNVTTPCGSVQIQRPFWVGKPAVPGPITGNTSPGPGSLTPYYINNLPAGASSMTWSLPYCVGCSQPWSFYSGQNDILMTANVGNSDGYVQAMGVNPCGTGGASLLYVTPSGSCDPCPRMYPNPVSNELSLEWMDTEGFVLSEDIESYQVSLYNAVGGIILTETTNNPSIKIDLSQLKNGFYYLHIENKDGLIRKQIRVER